MCSVGRPAIKPAFNGGGGAGGGGGGIGPRPTFGPDSPNFSWHKRYGGMAPVSGQWNPAFEGDKGPISKDGLQDRVKNNPSPTRTNSQLPNNLGGGPGPSGQGVSAPGGASAPGGGGNVSGAAPKAAQSQAPQRTTSKPGMNPLALSALNKKNELPKQVAQKSAQQAAKRTEQNRSPENKKNGPTEDKRLNEEIAKFSKAMGEKLDKFQESFEAKLKSDKPEDRKFASEFDKNADGKEFATPEGREKLFNNLKQDFKEGDFNQENRDRFADFVDAIPESKEKDMAQEVLDGYDNLDKIEATKENDYAAGDMVSLSDNAKDKADKFAADVSADSSLDAKTKDTAADFAEGLKDTADKARGTIADTNMGKAEQKEYFKEGGEHDKAISALKDQYAEIREDLTDDQRVKAEEALADLTLQKQVHPSADGAEKYQAFREKAVEDGIITKDEDGKVQIDSEKFNQMFDEEAGIETGPKPGVDLQELQEKGEHPGLREHEGDNRRDVLDPNQPNTIRTEEDTANRFGGDQPQTDFTEQRTDERVEGLNDIFQDDAVEEPETTEAEPVVAEAEEGVSSEEVNDLFDEMEQTEEPEEVEEEVEDYYEEEEEVEEDYDE